MQIKTIKKIITAKLEEWLLSIADESLRNDVKKNILVSGGSITSLLLNEQVNDYDIYIQDMDVLLRLAKYYCPNDVLDGRKREEYLKEYFDDRFDDQAYTKLRMDELSDDQSELVVRYKNLKPDQVKLNIPSFGVRLQEPQEHEKYVPVFLSQNAISLSNDIQIVLRFNGNAEQIHKTFDFIHATNYFTFENGLVTNTKALECILTKELKYQGSLYPLTTIIRVKKFLRRNWKINAGELLKVMFQISELNLKDPEVLEEQLIGVDIAYFSKLVEVLRGVPEDKITSPYINEIIDRIFNDFEDEEA